MQRPPFDPYGGNEQEDYLQQPDGLPEYPPRDDAPAAPVAAEPRPDDPFEGTAATESAQEKGATAPEEKQPPKPSPSAVGMGEVLGGEASPQNRGILSLLLILIVLAATAILIYCYAFRLERIEVVGLSSDTRDKVITISGLVIGRNMFLIQENQVRENFSGNIEYIYEGMQKDYGTKTICLYVRDRVPVAVLSLFGSYYLLDSDGMVMKQCDKADIPEGFPTITGVSVSSVRPGSLLDGLSPAKLRAYQAVMNAMKRTDSLKTINLSDPEKIYVETGNNLSLILGNTDYMNAKLKAYRWYLKLAFGQLPAGGVLDLTIPEDARFLPDNKD